jgi:hypothetical protein
VAAIAIAALSACSEDPTNVPVTAGTIGGIAFSVTTGAVLQPNADGPLFADGAGAVIVLEPSVGALGMSVPTRLHLRTQFALRDSGSITIGAFGTRSDPFGPGTDVRIERNGLALDYTFRVASAVFVDSTFVPLPASNLEQWVVTEFYAQDVPGYGAGSGVAMWPLNDLDPTLGEDVLGCTPGPAMHTATLGGDRVAYRITSGFLIGLEVVDTIVGPCVP